MAVLKIGSAGTVEETNAVTATTIATTGLIQGNKLEFRDDTFTQWSNNGTATLYISYSGYNGGFTQFRDLWIGNGKGAVILSIIGSTKTSTFSGPVLATTVKATSSGGYISSDGSAGITTTVTTASLVGKTITIKDGIITGFA